MNALAEESVVQIMLADRYLPAWTHPRAYQADQPCKPGDLVYIASGWWEGLYGVVAGHGRGRWTGPLETCERMGSPDEFWNEEQSGG